MVEFKERESKWLVKKERKINENKVHFLKENMKRSLQENRKIAKANIKEQKRIKTEKS